MCEAIAKHSGKRCKCLGKFIPTSRRMLCPYHKGGKSWDNKTRKYKGDTQSIVDNLAVLPLSDLENNLIKNPYFIKLAIERKEELARQKNLVDPQIIQRELKKIVREKNFAWKKKKDFNIRNNLDYKGNPIGKNKDKV